jgi:hypothetical protein
MKWSLHHLEFIDSSQYIILGMHKLVVQGLKQSHRLYVSILHLIKKIDLLLGHLALFDLTQDINESFIKLGYLLRIEFQVAELITSVFQAVFYLRVLVLQDPSEACPAWCCVGKVQIFLTATVYQ